MAVRVCWMCGKPSETGEHRIKKSDLVERFGRGPFRGDEALVHVKAGRMRDLQGPDSKLVKYERNLCAYCNNTVTQPFDKAYEQFVPWVMANEADVVRRRVIDFEAVYGAEWANKQLDLFKFFAKCFGCRVDEAGRTVPRDVIDLMGRDTFETQLYVTFAVNEEQQSRAPGNQAIGTQDLLDYKSRSTGELLGYECGLHYRWLLMMLWYNHFPHEPLGASWVASSRFLYVGWYVPPSVEEGADPLARLGGLRK